MIEALQKEVEKIRVDSFHDEKDEDLSFTVNLLIVPNDNKNKDDDKVILTVNHHGYILSRVIFPKSSHYEYLSLRDEMSYLYNATM